MKVTTTESGFSAISNVDSSIGGHKKDEMESFIFGEVLKYVYIAFLEDGAFQVARDGANSFVFNTEAHPVKVHRTNKQNGEDSGKQKH